MHCSPPLLAPPAPMSRGDRWLVACLALFFLVFGVAVEMRSAFMQRPMTDLGCFLRGSWALRNGQDLYEVTDDNGWHYNYPPFLAIVMAPLADAPAGEERAGLLPYPVSVAVWYLLSVVLFVLAIHWLACTVERPSADAGGRATPWGCHEWWQRRLVPLFVCLPPAAHTLMRGQVNILILLALVGAVAWALRGKRFRAGFCLALGAAIKIYPAFLFVVPLWRRDWRMLAGGTVGLAATLVLLPALVMGPSATVASYEKLFAVVLMPGLTHAGDESRAKELTNVTATGAQSFAPVLHNTLHPDRDTRPAHAALAVRLAGSGAASVLTLGALVLSSRTRAWTSPETASRGLIAWGLLILAMLFTSPISHTHYFCYCLPLVLGLNELIPSSGRQRTLWVALGWVFIVAYVLPQIPALAVLRDLGLLMYAALLLWIVGLVVLVRSAKSTAPAETAAPLRKAA